MRKLKYKSGLNSFYIIKCDKYYKLGFSVCPERRISEIERHNPFENFLVYYHPSRFSKYTEIYWHTVFHDKRVKFEWFKLNDEDIQKIIKETPLVSNYDFLNKNYKEIYDKYLKTSYYQGKNTVGFYGLKALE